MLLAAFFPIFYCFASSSHIHQSMNVVTEASYFSRAKLLTLYKLSSSDMYLTAVAKASSFWERQME
jgi:hypothetical protein